MLVGYHQVNEGDKMWSEEFSEFIPVPNIPGFVGQPLEVFDFPIIRPMQPGDESLNAITVTGQIFEDLHNMHAQFGFHQHTFDLEALNHRLDFLQEELDETRAAIRDHDAAGVLDGLIDLIVVAAGTVDLANADGTKAWKEVMDKNNQKEVGFNPTRPNSKGVDLIKPEGWTPPNVAPFVGNLITIVHENTVFAVNSLEPAINPFDDMVDDDTSLKDRGAVKALEECIALMRRKAQDYTSEMSSVVPADYYPEGIKDFIYMIDVLKRFRMLSVLDNMKAGGAPNFDTLEDIMMDRIVYTALAIEWIRYQMQGQSLDRDIWNRPVARIVGEVHED